MSGYGGSIHRTGTDSKREYIGTVKATKELLTKIFHGITWENSPMGEFGYYRPGNGQVAFGIFNSRTYVSSLDIELKGSLDRETFELLNDTCDKNGWRFQSDDELEKLMMAEEAKVEMEHPGEEPAQAAGEEAPSSGGASPIMQALAEAKAKAMGRDGTQMAAQTGVAAG